MTRLKWAKVTAISLLVYAVFLWVQAAWNIWPTEQSHVVAKAFGGAAIISWVALFFEGR